jgi:hypothetical protein
MPRPAVVLVLALVFAVPAHAELVPYRMDSSNQAGWWKPIDVLDGSVYVAYNAGRENSPDHTVYIAKRTLDGAWSRGCAIRRRVCASYPDDIGHNQPTIALDGDGYIHLFASMHGDPWRYWRSRKPGDVATLKRRSPELPDQGGLFTYPIAARAPNGDLYLIVRDRWKGVLYRWDNIADEWGRVATFADDRAFLAYPDDLVIDAAGTVHIAWEWSVWGVGCGGCRHLPSYLRYDPETGTFSNVAGAGVAIPTRPDSLIAYEGLVEGERLDREQNGLGVQSAKIVVDPATGYPTAVYRQRTVVGGPFTVRLARWDGAAWQYETVYNGGTYPALGLSLREGAPLAYYAKLGDVVERLGVAREGATDHLYLASPGTRRLCYETR